MKYRLFLLLVVGLLLAAQDPKNDAPKSDLDKMQGTWKVEMAAKRGEAMPKESLEKMKVVITGEKAAVHDGDRVEEATIKLDPAKKTIDFIPAGAAADKKAEGIYQLDDDTVKLCWAKPGNPRPTEFATGKENSHTIFVLKRAK